MGEKFPGDTVLLLVLPGEKAEKLFLNRLPGEGAGDLLLLKAPTLSLDLLPREGMVNLLPREGMGGLLLIKPPMLFLDCILGEGAGDSLLLMPVFDRILLGVKGGDKKGCPAIKSSASSWSFTSSSSVFVD
jgi:hypothetical protein